MLVGVLSTHSLLLLLIKTRGAIFALCRTLGLGVCVLKTEYIRFLLLIESIWCSVQCNNTNIKFQDSCMWLFAVYQVEVATQSGRYYRVERRYSAFHSLNKECKRQYHGQAHRIAEFPPKRIRNTSAKVLESRRTGLEHYIQSLVRLSPTPPQLIAFLELPPRYKTLIGETTISSYLFEFLSQPWGWRKLPWSCDWVQAGSSTRGLW